jgi:hypothetical protein
VATGTGVTVTTVVPLTPSTVALIVDVPAAAAVTKPTLDTVATVVFEEDQVVVRPERTFADASFAVAESCWLCPTVIVAVAGVTATLATAATTGLTVMTAVADLPPAEAVMTVAPAESAETKPVAVMVATFGDDEVQLTVAPDTVRPCESTGFTVICTNPLASNVAFGGVIEMLATACTAAVTVTSE